MRLGTCSWGLYGVGIVCCAAILGCAGEKSDAGAQLDAGASSDAASSPNTQGSIEWAQCGRLQCAELEVPLDHAQKEGPTLTLALASLQFRPDPKVTIVINPGGPGTSGIDLLTKLGSGGFKGPLTNYRLVSFDPRGVGQSGGTSCPDFRPLPPDVDTLEEELLAITTAGSACATAYGPLFEHLGSNEVVADMELLRQALAEERLNFLGLSYGARLGALYHMRYPDHAGRIVLDAPLSSSSSVLELLKAQALGMEQALNRFFDVCLNTYPDPCPADPRATLTELLAAASAGVLKVEDTLIPEAAVLAVWKSLLPTPKHYDALVIILEEYVNGGNTTTLEQLVAPLLGESEPPLGALPVNRSVLCADDRDSALSEAEINAAREDLEQLAPMFASTYSVELAVCSAWPVPSDPLPTLGDDSVAPLLLIGGSEDPSTPVGFAEDLAGHFAAARLLVSHHEGHTVSLAGDLCVDAAIDQFLASGELPPLGSECGTE